VNSSGHCEALARKCVGLCILMKRGTQKTGITTPWFPVCYILHPHKGISSHMMGDVVLGGKFPHPMLREFSCLMALQRAWGVFVVITIDTSCSPKCWFQIGSSMEQDRYVIPVEPWTADGGNWTRAIEPQNSRSCQEIGTQATGSWRGRGLVGSAYTVWPIRKDLVVMSQWAQHPWILESPEAAPSWPVAMAAQPAKQKEAGGWCSCLVWKSSQLSGA
jgi:hypothetical protein